MDLLNSVFKAECTECTIWRICQ